MDCALLIEELKARKEDWLAVFIKIIFAKTIFFIFLEKYKFVNCEVVVNSGRVKHICRIAGCFAVLSTLGFFSWDENSPVYSNSFTNKWHALCAFFRENCQSKGISLMPKGKLFSVFPWLWCHIRLTVSNFYHTQDLNPRSTSFYIENKLLIKCFLISTCNLVT